MRQIWIILGFLVGFIIMCMIMGCGNRNTSSENVPSEFSSMRWERIGCVGNAVNIYYIQLEGDTFGYVIGYSGSTGIALIDKVPHKYKDVFWKKP